MRALRSFALVVFVFVLGCGHDASSSTKPKVAVSIFPLHDIARRVAGDRLDVVLVLPAGRSEHGYDPTPREMANVAGSRLAVVVGLEMDPWAERIIRGAAGADVQIVRLGPAVDPRRLSEPEVGVDLIEHAHEAHEGEEHHDEAHEGEEPESEEHHDEHEGEEHHDEEHEEHHEHAHHHGAFDPHFWLDPVRMRTAVDRLVEAFVALDPAGAESFRANGERVKTELAALHTRLQARARTWQRRTIVTFHGSFGYFAERYGLRIAAVIEPFPGREPTPRYMQDVLSAIRASGAAALFSEPQLDPRPARVIADQAGVPLHAIDPVGGTAGVDTYERLLEHDASVFDRALGAAP